MLLCRKLIKYLNFCNLQKHDSNWIVRVWVSCNLYSFYTSVIPCDCLSMTFQLTFLATASARQAVTSELQYIKLSWWPTNFFYWFSCFDVQKTSVMLPLIDTGVSKFQICPFLFVLPFCPRSSNKMCLMSCTWWGKMPGHIKNSGILD